jgi:hypothetical protein
LEKERLILNPANGYIVLSKMIRIWTLKQPSTTCMWRKRNDEIKDDGGWWNG